MNIIYNSLVYLVWFLATYYSIFLVLSIIHNKDRIFENKKKMPMHKPFVTILVPAYNEEADISETISSLKKITYKKVEFIVINDGSKDNTSKIVRAKIKGDNRFKFIDNKINKGKAACLNQGIEKAKGSYVACMDADSIIEPGVFEKVLPYFNSKDIGAVTISVDVHKPKTLLHKMVAMEFALGLSLFLKICSLFDCVFVTPGPFSVYRKSALDKIGGYDINNITEDHEIAFRLHKAKYKIRNCIEAKVKTVLPIKFKDIFIQRRRWYSGSIQTLVQHRDMLLSGKHGWFGYFVPYNFMLVLLGFGVFGASTYLWLSKNLQELLYFRYTNFNFLDHFFSIDLDLLNYGRVNLLGLSMFIATLAILFVGAHYVKKNFKSNRAGMIAYPFMFFLYQIFWGGAFLAVIRGKKIKWR